MSQENKYRDKDKNIYSMPNFYNFQTFHMNASQGDSIYTRGSGGQDYLDFTTDDLLNIKANRIYGESVNGCLINVLFNFIDNWKSVNLSWGTINYIRLFNVFDSTMFQNFDVYLISYNGFVQISDKTTSILYYARTFNKIENNSELAQLYFQAYSFSNKVNTSNCSGNLCLSTYFLLVKI